MFHPHNQRLPGQQSSGYQSPILLDEPPPLLPKPRAYQEKSVMARSNSSITRHNNRYNNRTENSHTYADLTSRQSPNFAQSDDHTPFLPTDQATYSASELRFETQLTSQQPTNRPDGKLPNRFYYPSSRHQEAFDTLLSTNPIEFERRENEGLNSLDGHRKEPPIYATPIIIQCAILGAPHQSLTLSELRATLKIRFQYYDVADIATVKSWERTLLRTLSDHTRFQCSKRMGPSGASWTINHNAPPIKCTPKRQCHIRKKKMCPGEQLDHLNHMDNDTTESDSTASISVGRSPSITDDARRDEVQSLFPVVPASGPHGRYIKLPPLPSSRREWCPTSPRLWSRSEFSRREL